MKYLVLIGLICVFQNIVSGSITKSHSGNEIDDDESELYNQLLKEAETRKYMAAEIENFECFRNAVNLKRKPYYEFVQNELGDFFFRKESLEYMLPKACPHIPEMTECIRKIPIQGVDNEKIPHFLTKIFKFLCGDDNGKRLLDVYENDAHNCVTTTKKGELESCFRAMKGDTDYLSPNSADCNDMVKLGNCIENVVANECEAPKAANFMADLFNEMIFNIIECKKEEH